MIWIISLAVRILNWICLDKRNSMVALKCAEIKRSKANRRDFWNSLLHYVHSNQHKPNLQYRYHETWNKCITEFASHPFWLLMKYANLFTRHWTMFHDWTRWAVWSNKSLMHLISRSKTFVIWYLKNVNITSSHLAKPT